MKELNFEQIVGNTVPLAGHSFKCEPVQTSTLARCQKLLASHNSRCG